MKVKTFILTFLMMSCPFLFGQSHWVDPILPGEDVMTVTAKVTLDGIPQSGESYEVAVFNAEDNKLVEVGKFTNHGITELEYHVGLSIPGAAGDRFYFKFFNGTYEYVSLTEIDYVAQQGSHLNLFTIQFKAVAKIGNVVYPSLQEAFAAAQSGETITLVANTDENILVGNENLKPYNKSVIVEGDGFKATGGWNFGRDDNNADNGEITINNVEFSNKGVAVVEFKNVTITNCVFDNITSELAAIRVICDDSTDEVTLTGNTITNVSCENASGIRVRGAKDATVSDNVITNVNFTSILFEGTTNNNLVIKNNVIKNWAYANGSAANDGRAIRIAKGEGTCTVEDNAMIIDYSAPEEFVKVDGNTSKVSFDKNYWDAEEPKAPTHYNTVVKVDSYYAAFDETTKELSDLRTINYVAQIGDIKYSSLQAAIDDATVGQTVTVINDVELENTVTVAAGKVVTLDLNGKTVSGISNVASTSAVILNKGNLTVKTSVEGGKITTKALQPDTNWGGEGEPPYPTYANNTIRNEGTFTLVSGRIENMSPAGGATYAIDNYNGSTTNIEGGEVYCENNLAIRLFCGNNISLNVNGGKIQGTRALWIQLANSDSSVAPNVEVNISDGEIRATGEKNGYIQALYSYSYGNDMKNVEINISGGTFYGDINLTGGNNKTNIETLNISGGIFNGNEYDINSYGADEKAVGAISITGGTFSKNYAEKYALDNGYVFVENSNGKYELDEFNGFEIPNLDRLIAFRNAVNAGNTFKNQTVTVTADINMESVENWTPIGTLANPFNGTFDGGNKTISNLKVDGGAYVGLFGYADNATIKNVKINNANVKGTNCVGVIAGNVYSTSLIDNCHVSGSIKVEGQTNVGGIVGKYYTKVTNSSVIGDGVATSYVKGVHYAADYEGDNIGGIMGHAGEDNTHSGNTVKNITISGTRKVGGLIGVTDQNTDVTNCVVENVNIETTATAEYASANAAKAGHASIVGSYTKLGTNNNGTVTNCVVKNVTFVNEGDVVVSFGPITGGAREGMIDPTGVTASGNLIYMSTISDNTTNMYLMKAVAKIGETNYYTLDEAIAAANNQTVTVLENVTLRNTLTIEAGKTVTLDLNGQTINTAWEDESAEKHYYAFDNKGTLTITNSSTEANGIINARGNFNYGTLTLEKGTINAIDHNGGYGVRNYDGATFTMNGGTIAATNDGNDAPGVTGAYDATTVRVDEGATFTMNGGTINNSCNYTFAIENNGTTTIEGGTITSVHTTVANHGTMTINGGTFICDGLEGITAHALWAAAGETTINGGTFNGKDNYNGFNVCASAGAVVEINGGNFESVHSGSLYGDGTITVKGGTFFDEVAEERLADGYVCKQNTDGTYGVFLGVAKIEGTGAIYGTLQAAITAAQSGNTIVLLADITENVTVNSKSLTIDGAEKSYTGNIAVKGSASSTAVTVKNVNFVNGTGYAITTNTIKSITVKNCTVSNYAYGFMYANKTTTNVIVKNVTVNGGSYGLRWLYGTTATFENVKMENVTDGFEIHTYGAKTINVKDCDITSIDIYYRSATNQTFKFEGENKVGTLSDSQYAKYQLVPASSTLAAPAGSDVTTSAGYMVEYKEGKYVVKAAIAQVGDVIYESLQKAIDAAVTDQTVVLLQDITLTEADCVAGADRKVLVDVANKDITLDMNGKKISVTHMDEFTNDYIVAVIRVADGAGLTVTGNGTIEVNVLADNPDIAYMFWKRGTTGHLTIMNGTFHMNDAADSMVYTNGNEIVFIKGGNWTLDAYGTRGNREPWIFNVAGAGDNHVLVTGGTFNADINRQHWSNEVIVPETHYTVNNGNNTYTVNEGAEAYVYTGMTTGPYFAPKNIGYATLEEALAKAQEFVDKNVTILKEVVTLDESLTIQAGKEIILDLKGNDINVANDQVNFNINGKLTLNDETGEGVFTSRNHFVNAGAEFIVNGGTVQNVETATGGFPINLNGGSVTINGGTVQAVNNDNYAIGGNGGTLVIEGGTVKGNWGAVNLQSGNATIKDGTLEVTGTTGGHALYVAGDAEVTIEGGEFKPYNGNGVASYALVLNSENAKVNVSGGMFHKEWGCVLVNAGKLSLTGGTFEQDVNAYCAKGYGAIANATETLWTVMPVQEQSFVKGWNWYSTYLDIELNDLTNALGDNGSYIKNSRGNYVENIGNNTWLGDDELTTISPSEMYLVQTTEECDLKLAADLVNPSNHLINLNSGWSWIGYPSNQEGVAVGVALANIPNPKEGDLIKTLNNGYAEYAFGYWLGTLNTMVPGIGYKYHNTSGEGKTFYYNIETTTRGAVEANVTAENNYWTPNATKYPFNMTMTAVVDGLADGNYEVAAFVNGELRGSARPIYVEPMDAYVFFLTIHGEDVEEMSFRLYDIDNDTEYDLSDRINYSNDAHLGSVNEPYVFSRGTTGIGEASMSEVNIYPNPTTTGTEINLEATCDKVEVFNALGVKVAEYQNVDSIDALETAGIYVIRITNNGNVQNCRLVVK